MENTEREANGYAEGKPWSRVIWDVTAVGWLLNDGQRFMRSYVTKAPVPEYDHRWSTDPFGNNIAYVYRIQRDALFEDLFRKIASM